MRLSIRMRHPKRVELLSIFLCALSLIAGRASFGQNLFGWGADDLGQLGDGSPEEARYAATPAAISRRVGPVGATAVFAGAGRTFILRQDGQVWATGDNAEGEFGEGDQTDHAAPVHVSAWDGFVQISCGYAHTLGLKADGTVWSCGQNFYGELGVAANEGTSAPVLTPMQIPGLTGVVKVAASDMFSLAVKSDGTLWSWGFDAYGELGNGAANFLQNPTPTQVPGLTGVTSVAAGAYHVLAVIAGSRVYAWGGNRDGQLGLGSADNVAHPAPTLLSSLDGAILVAAGDLHSFAVMSDHTVRAWGNNASGQLGDGSTAQHNAPEAVAALSGYVPIPGTSFTLALRSDGAAIACGENNQGQLGNTLNSGTTNGVSSPVSITVLSNTTALAVGAAHGVALRSDGSARSWGDNTYGELGRGASATTPSPFAQPMPAFNYAGAAAGDVDIDFQTGVAALADGSVVTWGDNEFGQLGNGTVDSNAHPTPATVPGLQNVVCVAAGPFNIYAAKSDGAVWAWGSNDFGQLGIGGYDSDQHPTPTQVPALTGAVAVTAARDVTAVYALKGDGTVWAWGFNGDGELGHAPGTDGDIKDAEGQWIGVIPTQVMWNASTPLSDIVMVSAGGYFCLALDGNGDIFSWGYNASGALGEYETGQTYSATPYYAQSGYFTAIAAGEFHCLALDGAGSVHTWGSNVHGELGYGTGDSNARPDAMAVPNLSNVTAIAAGSESSFGILSTGAMVAWGSGSFGQLGDDFVGYSMGSPSPTPVHKLSGAVAVWGGTYETFALGRQANPFYLSAELFPGFAPIAQDNSDLIPPLEVSFNTSGDSPLFSRSVIPSVDGQLIFADIDPGDYLVKVVGDRWLRQDQNLTVLDADGAAAESDLVFNLIPGDLNADNAIDLNDFSLFVQVFGLSAGPGQTADLNMDGVIDLNDFSIFVQGFGLSGDP